MSGESSEKRQKLDKIDLNSEEAKALLNRKSVNAHLIKKVEYFKIWAQMMKTCWLKSLGLITCSVHGLEQQDSGCLKGKSAMTVPNCSQFIWIQGPQHLHASDRRTTQLSYLLLLMDMENCMNNLNNGTIPKRLPLTKSTFCLSTWHRQSFGPNKTLKLRFLA